MHLPVKNPHQALSDCWLAALNEPDIFTARSTGRILRDHQARDAVHVISCQVMRGTKGEGPIPISGFAMRPPLTHMALSPKEIGADPGGTPRTFWLPV